jgi:hypothetical protein
LYVLRVFISVPNDLQTAVGDSVFAVTQSASFLSTSTLNGGVPAVSTAAASASTVTNALIPPNPVVEQSVSQMNNCAGFYVSSVTAAGAIEDATKKPVFLASSTGQQVLENVEKKKRQKTTVEGNTQDSRSTVYRCTVERVFCSTDGGYIVGSSTAIDDKSAQKSGEKKTAVGTPCQVAEITTSAVNDVRDNSSAADSTQTTTTVSAAPITTSSVVASVPATKIATPSVPITANG